MAVSKKDLYGWIKIAGMLSFVPFVLAAGALAGYLAGDYLKAKFAFAYFVLPVCIGIGIIASIIEAIRIIRLTLRINKKI